MRGLPLVAATVSGPGRRRGERPCHAVHPVPRWEERSLEDERVDEGT